MSSIKSVVNGMKGGLQKAINQNIEGRDTAKQQLKTIEKLSNRIGELSNILDNLESYIKDNNLKMAEIYVKKAKQVLG
ncbi:hypothetical protein [Hippea alviniae]|uniref:hypothetical protein n=1 Tax=Hippea alviniae TaxID=1279027 RepID=UPI0003B50F8B|nr:hypothetical protein [Hippea alviniae]